MRLQYGALRSRSGDPRIGSAGEVVGKVCQVNEVPGATERIPLQMTNVPLPHAKVLRAVEIPGSEVAPRVRKSTEATLANSGSPGGCS